MKVGYNLVEKYTNDLAMLTNLTGSDFKKYHYPILVVTLQDEETGNGNIVVLQREDLANVTAMYQLTLAKLIPEKI